MKSLKRLLLNIGRLIASLYNDLCDGASAGIEEEDIGKVLLNVLLFVLMTAFLTLSGLIFLNLIISKIHVVIIGGFLAAGSYSALIKLFDAGEPEPLKKPTVEDYKVVLETIKPAAATVAQALGLAPIYGHTDISADPEEWILPWGKVWQMKFKLLKKDASAPIDTALCKRIIQAQVKSVLERENPSGLANVRFQWGGRMEPIIQIRDVSDGDAFVYLFAVIASAEYFNQKSEWENRSRLLTTGADTDDVDF